MRVDAVLLEPAAGLKKASRSGDLVARRRPAVVVEELDVVAEQAVAEAEGGGRELVGDARVDVRACSRGTAGSAFGPSRAGRHSL